MRVRFLKISAVLVAITAGVILLAKAALVINWNPRYQVGQELDRLNGVAVYYNGGVGHSSGRGVTADGYNLGQKYQCVEFVKRYYFQYLHHRMPDSYGHAWQFFDPAVPDGRTNRQRGLLQYVNGGQTKPQADDLLVFGPSLLNPYGHVAIVSAVSETEVEIVQQNPGPFGSSRERIPISSAGNFWRVQNSRVRGWLRIP